MDGDGRRHGRFPIAPNGGLGAGGGEGQRDGAVAGVVAGDGIVALLHVCFHDSEGLVHNLPGTQRGDVGITQCQGVLVVGEHVADALIHLLRRSGGGDVLSGLHQISQSGAGGAPDTVHIPGGGQPQGRVHHAGQHGCRRAPGDGPVRQVRTGGVGAHGDARPVQEQNVLIVVGVLGDVGDEFAAGVPFRHQFVIDGGQDLRRQGARQHVGHLGPGGGSGQAAVQLRAQNALRLEIAQIALGRGGVAVPAPGAGTGFGVAGAVKAAEPGGKDHDLSHGHGILQTEGAVGLAHGQAVLIQRDHIVVKYRVRRQVGKLPGIGFAADEVVGAVLRRQDRDAQQQADGQGQCQDAGFHSGPPLGADGLPDRNSGGDVQVRHDPVFHIGVQVLVHHL